MKNCDEMVNSLLERRQVYLNEQKRKRKKHVRNAVSVCSVCLVALLSFGAVQSGMFESRPPVVAEDSKGTQEKDHSRVETSDGISLPAEESKYSQAETSDDISAGEEDRIIWADSVITEDHEGVVDWNGDWLSWSLHCALEEASETDVFAIFAKPSIDSMFEYNGMRMEEYYFAMSEEKNLPGKLVQLLKDGDALKYGEALYTTGTPDGERWVKELYDERVRFYGEDLLSQYIVDGNFLKDRLEKDIPEAERKSDATLAYQEAENAYLTALSQTVQGAYPTEVKAEQSGLLLFMTREQFVSFTAENVGEWIFNLASKNGIPSDFCDAE